MTLTNFVRWRYPLLLVPVIGLMAGSPVGPAHADDQLTETERLLGEGIASLMQALELLLKTVPQYAAPEMLPNGDIIIRRLQPQDEAPAPPSPADPESDSTDT